MNSLKILNKMRGISVLKFGGVEQLVVENGLAIPEVQNKQVLIQMKASGVNPVDTYIRSGVYPHLPPLPYIPGKEGAGVIAKVGKDVHKFKVGDKVFCCENSIHGSLAEYMCVQENNVYPLGALSFNEGAAISIAYFTAFRALMFKAKGDSGKRVLVHGASGTVGLATVQIAKANGMIVVGTAGTEEGIAVARKSGADAMFNHRQESYVDELKKLDKFDIIVEMLSNVNLQNDLMLMAPRGITVVVGCRGEVQINPRLLMTTECSVIGCQLFQANEEEQKTTSEAICKGISDGWVKPVVNRVYPLEQVQKAHVDIINTGSKGAAGKLVVEIQE